MSIFYRLDLKGKTIEQIIAQARKQKGKLGSVNGQSSPIWQHLSEMLRWMTAEENVGFTEVCRRILLKHGDYITPANLAGFFNRYKIEYKALNGGRRPDFTKSQVARMKKQRFEEQMSMGEIAKYWKRSKVCIWTYLNDRHKAPLNP